MKDTIKVAFLDGSCESYYAAGKLKLEDGYFLFEVLMGFDEQFATVIIPKEVVKVIKLIKAG